MGKVNHVVLFKMNSKSFTRQIELKASSECATLMQIPGVLSVQFGKTFTTDRCGEYTHCLVVIFEDRSYLSGYGPHSIHKAWAEQFVAPHKQGILAMDIDTKIHSKI